MTSVLVAAGDAGWQQGVLSALDRQDLGVRVSRRCVDVAELLAAAAAGLGSVALVDAGLRRLDRDAVARLAACGVGIVVVASPDASVTTRLQQLGVERIVAPGTAVEDIAAMLRAVRPEVRVLDDGDPLRALPELAAVQNLPSLPDGPRGQLIAVWGPTGAPGRTTIAISLAAELAARGGCLLIDADPYGGCVAQVLGLLEEAPGLAAAARAATAGSLDGPSLAFLCRDLGRGLLVLPGLLRPERWPELRASSVGAVLEVARRLAPTVVVDCGFCLEQDEELTFDTIAPRRNGATLAVLAAADTVLAVGAADPVGLGRLVRGVAGLPQRPQVILNKVRSGEREARALIAEHLGEPVATIPWDQVAVDGAVAQGRPLNEVAPRSPARRAIAGLAATLSHGAPPRRRFARSFTN